MRITMPLVAAENLAKAYGRVKAVDGLSLSLDDSSVTGLIGPNGAGKTTTIKMILGLLKPDSGQVRVFGEDPWDNSSIRTRVGVVHEKAFFPSHYKTMDYLEKTCRIFGVPESRANEVLRMVELQDAGDRAIKALSAGMLQKFAIAHALVHDPQLIVADEMTANLDPQARSSLLDLVLKLHKEEKATFLLSSHILPELSRVCDSVAIINQGKVWASGKLTELYDKYAAGTIRISTDKPEELAVEIRKLPYVERIDSDIRGLSIRIRSGNEDRLYEDAPGLARKVEARIQGIETGSASLEELYRMAVGGNRGG
jgi:ABC-2 type transport system ATP-binding protein